MNYKLSKYLVFSEPIINSNYRLVYSTISTTLTLLKVNIYDKLINKDFFSLKNDSIFDRLISSKIIIDKTRNELEQIIKYNKKAIANENVLYQIISPSANCQLGCNYCGQVHTKKSLDDNLNKKITARIAVNITLKKYKHLHIGWFGAEPLMGLKNIKKLTLGFMNLANKNNCSYSANMITNGLSLKKDIFFDLVEKYKITKFEITLDGTQKHHDLRRHTKLKEKTFSLIFKNLKNIVNDNRFEKSKHKIIIRCNVDSSNYKSTYDLINLLEVEKILDKISFYTAPIHSWGNDAHLKSLTHEEYSEFQIETFIELIDKKHKVVLLPGIKTPIVCTSLYEHAEVFDTDGNVFNCTEISQVPIYENDDSFKVKKLYDETYTNNNRPYSSWNDDILNGEVPCTNCVILPICGGACPKLWKENISPCPPIKYNIKDRLLLHFSQNNRKILSKKNV